jgi:hypothetical protein
MADESEFDHALKNQLAIILGYADLLLADSNPGESRFEDLQEIHKAASHALALFDRHRRTAE